MSTCGRCGWRVREGDCPACVDCGECATIVPDYERCRECDIDHVMRASTCAVCGLFIGNENAKAFFRVCECAVPSYPADDKPPQ